MEYLTIQRLWATTRLLVTRFSVLFTQWKSSPYRKWGRGVGPKFHLVFSFGVNHVYSFGLNLGARGEHLMFIASAKIPEREGNISSFNFYGQLPDYWSQVFSLIYQVDECSFKEIKTWGQSEISFNIVLYLVWIKRIRRQGKLTLVVETPSSDRVAFRTLSNINNRAPPRKQPMA